VRRPQALRRADQVESAEGDVKRDWYAPIVADAEAGFGGVLNAYELMKARALRSVPVPRLGPDRSDESEGPRPVAPPNPLHHIDPDRRD